MESGISSDPVENATGILGQLLKYTQQLAASENDPRIDIAALSESCGQRLEDLKKVLPRALKDLASRQERTGCDPGEKSKILAKMKALHDQTRLSSEVLERARDKTAKQMANLSKSRRAIRAYSA
ncbi:MAG: hypothetical protein WAW37_20225 [Syntrophobacteraceae bacterium]